MTYMTYIKSFLPQKRATLLFECGPILYGGLARGPCSFGGCLTACDLLLC